MAEGTSEGINDVKADVFHEIETKCDDEVPTKLALLLKITQPGQRPLPIGVVTERSLKALIKQVTNREPLGVTIMNDTDVVVEFNKGVKVFEAAQQMYNLATWDQYKIEISTLMSTKNQIVGLVRERELMREESLKYRQKQQSLVEEEKAYRDDIQELLDRFENQVQRIEISHSKHTGISGPSDAGTIPTPDGTTAGHEDHPTTRHKLFKQPILPRFSGTVPVPKGEGSYEQYMFQIRGFRAAYTDEAIKSGIIGSVTDAARDYLDYVGFDRSLSAIMEALEQRYGQGFTTDKLQQDFYQLCQEKGEHVQQFAGRLELRYKKLIGLYPDRYNAGILKERLFYGMTQHLRDSMRYLYKQEGTTYEQLLTSAKEAELEWVEHKTLKVKSTTVADPGKKERDELRSRIEKLTAELNKKEKYYKKKKTPTSSPKDSPRSKFPNSTGSPNRKPAQCYKCGGWGHMRRECASSGNVNWEELNRVEPTPVVVDPELKSSNQP